VSSQPSVFISYASQDREAARAIRDVLLATGIEAWYDENELGGGDVWDQKIRRQIRECVYFMPVISANTEARVEGYFRREWRLAAERTLDMADDVAFLVPVVIDQTLQEHARVPEKFLASQWMRLPAGQPTPAFHAWCARITSNEPPPLPRSARVSPPVPAGKGGKPAGGLPPFPPFPHQVEGQSVKFGADIAIWIVHTAVAAYRHSPKWLRGLVIVWLIILFLRGCRSDTHETHQTVHRSATPEQMKKAQEVVKQFTGTGSAGDLIRQLSKQFGDAHNAQPALFLEAFTAPRNDPATAELANGIFAILYGNLAMDQSALIALDKNAPAAPDPAAALEHARDQDAKYLLSGTVTGKGEKKFLAVTVTAVAKGDILWTELYPVAGAVSTDIAKDIRSHLPPLSAAP